MNNKLTKNIIVAVVTIVILFALYFFFFRNNNTIDTETALYVEDQTNATLQVDKNLLSLLLEMKSIKLDEKLFNSPVFKSLNDYSIDIKIQEVGRINPFASLELK